MNIDVRMPLDLKASQTLDRKPKLRTVSQPAFEVSASGASGTRVTWSGTTSHTSAVKLPVGLPSMLNSVFRAGLRVRTSL